MATVFSARRAYSVPLAHGRQLRLDERPLVMGVLNVTPDSFADADHLTSPARAVDRALRMEDEGADLIDVGGESTRPGSDPVEADEELARTAPVVAALARRLRIPVSIDTYKSVVARAAIEAGAAMVNDVSGFHYDPEMAAEVARSGAAVVLMHTRGRSKTMYQEASYEDLIGEIGRELAERVQRATAAGVAADRVIVDPGIGFAKQPIHSYGVLAQLAALAAALGRPILAGPSRKSFMREALGDRPAAERDWGTAAAVAAAVLAGAHIVRVHAVAEMAQVVRVAEAIRRAGIGDTPTGLPEVIERRP
jgi:dihydropteroate synthase